jgi:hypothetical protein
MKNLTFYLALLAALTFQTTHLSAQTLIATYSLFETAADATGNNADINLINTPYEDGGIYVNGNYVSVDPDSSDATTPHISALTFASFTISVDFKIASPYASTRPIIIAGRSWRWMGAKLRTDSRLTLFYNGIDGPVSTTAVTPGTWHRLTLTHDGSIGRLYLDNGLEASQAFIPNDGNDRRITTSYTSSGTAFKGHLRNLKVYNGVGTLTSIGATPENSRFVLHQNTPNPFNPSTNIRYDVAPGGGHITLRIYDTKGRLVATLVDKAETPGQKFVTWDGKNNNGKKAATGVYFYRLSAPAFEQTRKMVLIK